MDSNKTAMSSGGADGGNGDERGADAAVQKEAMKVLLTGAPPGPAGVDAGGTGSSSAAGKRSIDPANQYGHEHCTSETESEVEVKTPNPVNPD